MRVMVPEVEVGSISTSHVTHVAQMMEEVRKRQLKKDWIQEHENMLVMGEGETL